MIQNMIIKPIFQTFLISSKTFKFSELPIGEFLKIFWKFYFSVTCTSVRMLFEIIFVPTADVGYDSVK